LAFVHDLASFGHSIYRDDGIAARERCRAMQQAAGASVHCSIASIERGLVYEVLCTVEERHLQALDLFLLQCVVIKYTHESSRGTEYMI
jgi:hypothetical protein